MANLMIRNVDPSLKERLRVRAAQHGHSMEAELRVILRDALVSDQQDEPNLAEAIRRRFADIGGVELEPHPSVPMPEPPQFSDFIETQVVGGRYGNASEVVRAALRLLEERETKLAALRAALIEGEESGDYQEFDFDAFLEEKRAGSVTAE